MVDEKEIENPHKVGLNEGQSQAFDDIMEYLANPQEDAFVLKGYAGTGKTFLVKRILEQIAERFPNRRIAITAPTNKAVRVLQVSSQFNVKGTGGSVFDDLFSSSEKLTYNTIHKLLGLTEQITASGQQLFKPSGKGNDITKYSYLIVDEVSMLDDELCELILTYRETLRIIFMGDGAQIPPVNKADCIPFRDDHNYLFKRAELTEIMRQKGDHPVVDASFLIRNNLTESQPLPVLQTKLNAEDNGIIFYDSNTDRELVRPMLDKYFNTDEFRADANYAKVIAWRNNSVNYMNKIIRELMYGTEADTYVVGEKLVANKPIFEKQQSKWGLQWTIQFNTSEEMEVIHVKEKIKNFYEAEFSLQAKIYELQVKAFDTASRSYFDTFIQVIHEESQEAYESVIARAKKAAIDARSKQQWATYYNVLKWSADVVYNYAITAHKAQGSTYKNVLLLEEDLDANNRVIERNRIKYTAYSRPTDKLFILRKNYG